MAGSESTRPRRVRWEIAERPDGGGRLLTRLEPPDARLYRELVGRVAPIVERRLRAGVLANRATAGGGSSMLAAWPPARRRWRRTIERATSPQARSAILVTDVHRCYASIQAGIVQRSLLGMGVPAGDAGEIGRFLFELGLAGVPGLPVGPEPSAILANAVLARLDDAVAATGCRSVRWVDDLVVIAPEPARLMAAFDAIRFGADQVGLALHGPKTRLFADASAAGAALIGRATSPAARCDMA